MNKLNIRYMNDSIKLFAPKPIRASSNRYGVKINRGNHNFSEVQCYSPELEKKSGITMEVKISRSIHKSLVENQFTSDLDESQDYDDFKNTLTDNKDNSESKSEILTILRSKSDYFQSTTYTSNQVFFDNSQDFNNSFDIRTSMPPLRPENPLYKNFEDESVNFHANCNLNFKESVSHLINNADYYQNCSVSYFYDNIGEKYDPK